METENGKTRLQQIVEQKAEQVRNAIEQAIDEGATVKNICSPIVTIDGVFLHKNINGGFSVVLYFDSEKIAKVFEPSKEDLEKIAQQKRAELEEIEKQIKSK